MRLDDKVYLFEKNETNYQIEKICPISRKNLHKAFRVIHNIIRQSYFLVVSAASGWRCVLLLFCGRISVLLFYS